MNRYALLFSVLTGGVLGLNPSPSNALPVCRDFPEECDVCSDAIFYLNNGHLGVGVPDGDAMYDVVLVAEYADGDITRLLLPNINMAHDCVIPNLANRQQITSMSLFALLAQPAGELELNIEVELR